jgi:hypothetical protein
MTDFSIPRIDRLIGGLMLFKRMLGADEVSAEHDVIYAGPATNDLSSDALTELDRLGWHWEEQYECWEFFT